MKLPCRALIIAGVLASATFAAGPVACTEHGEDRAIERGRSYLVWDMEPAAVGDAVGDAEDALRGPGAPVPVTRWVTREADGSVRELGRRQGLWIVADGTVWEMGATTAHWETRGCEYYDDEPGARSKTVTHESRGVVFDGRDGRRHELIEPVNAGEELDPDAPEDEVLVLGDFAQYHHPVASLGSLVILRSDEYSYACGAHGGVTASYLAYDLEAGRVVDLVGEAETLDVGTSHGAVIRAELMAEDAWEDGEISLTAVYPRMVEGRLTASLQFTADTCYACSDGAWHSYTTSAEVTAPRLPASMTPHARPPAVVVRALAGVDPGQGFGWSEVPTDGPLHEEIGRLFGTTNLA